MKTLAVGMGCLVLLAGFTGCYDNATLVNLNRDGSGTLVYRLFLSETMIDMLKRPSAGEVDIFEAMPANLGRHLGEGATLESSRSLTNRNGWAGFEAVYAFADINRVNLRGLDPMRGADDADPGPRDHGIGEDYQFGFTPGEVATLRMTPMAAVGSETSAGEDPAVDTSDLPLDTLRPLVQGMRVVFLVAVDGDIVETNARFQSAKRPNVVTVMDVSIDRLIDDPTGAALLQSGSRDDHGAALAALGIPGVKIEPPGKEIVIRFK